MTPISFRPLVVSSLLTLQLPCLAGLNLIGSGNWTGPNLIVNGSFELGHPGPGLANNQFWATGTGGTPYLPIPGWNGSGPADNYAVWGSDQSTPAFRLRNSDVLPDGQIGVYFGNGEFRTVSEVPVFNPDFSVTFPNPPVFGGPFYSGPTVLAQTIPTTAYPGATFGLSFWVSGEDAAGSPSPYSGIFGLRLTNVLPGDPVLYFSVPPGINSAIGSSHVYQFSFTPLNNTQPVTVEFINHGHLSWPGLFSGTTELVLDDVRAVVVPEPASMVLLLPGVLLLIRRP